jgi:hypothetical protein
MRKNALSNPDTHFLLHTGGNGIKAHVVEIPKAGKNSNTGAGGEIAGRHGLLARRALQGPQERGQRRGEGPVKIPQRNVTLVSVSKRLGKYFARGKKAMMEPLRIERRPRDESGPRNTARWPTAAIAIKSALKTIVIIIISHRHLLSSSDTCEAGSRRRQVEQYSTQAHHRLCRDNDFFFHRCYAFHLSPVFITHIIL